MNEVSNDSALAESNQNPAAHRLTEEAPELIKAQGALSDILASQNVTDMFGRSGLLATGPVRMQSDQFANQSRNMVIRPGEDEELPSKEPGLIVKFNVEAVNSIGEQELSRALREALAQIPVIAANYDLKDHSDDRQHPFAPIKAIFDEAMEKYSDRIPQEQLERLRQWSGFAEEKPYALTSKAGENEANQVFFSLSIPDVAAKKEVDGITLIKKLSQNIEERKSDIVKAVVQKLKDEHGASFTPEELSQLDKTDVVVTDKNQEWGSGVFLTFGRAKTEEEKKACTQPQEAVGDTPLSKISPKVLNDVIREVVFSAGEKEKLGEIYSQGAPAAQIIKDLQGALKGTGLEEKLQQELKTHAGDDVYGVNTVGANTYVPYIRINTQNDKAEATIELPMPKGLTFGQLVKAIADRETVKASAGNDAAVANDNEKGDALGALIKSAAIRREDGDGDDKPKGPFGSPGDEPKPGGSDVNHEVAANSDAANSNIAAGAEHEGRVSEPKKRQVS